MARHEIKIGRFPPGWGQSFKAGKELEGLQPGGNSLSPLTRKLIRTVELGTAASLLASCSTPSAGATGITPDTLPVTPTRPTETSPSTPIVTPSATETTNPIVSLDPKVQELFTAQNVGGYEVGNNGAFNIDLYDSAEKEAIEINSFSRVDTQDGLNPNILTAVDKENNNYAYNPEQGWFKVPEVYNPEIDWKELIDNWSAGKYYGYTETNELLNPENGQYTEVSENFFTDGRANIVTALQYAENPTISPDAIDPHYWANYSWFKNVLYIGLHPGVDIVGANLNWPDLRSSSYYEVENKPFALTGFYKVNLNNGEIAYVNARTQKNPTENNQNQLINLFYGFDQKTYELMANVISQGADDSTLTANFRSINGGDLDVAAILAPPVGLPDGRSVTFDQNAAIGSDPNPVLGSLQKEGKIMSHFTDKDQLAIIQTILNGLDYLETNQYTESKPFVAPLNSLPPELSKSILHTTFNQ